MEEVNVKLSPPWYTFRNELYYTVGVTPGVEVGELVAVDTGYTLSVMVTSCKIQAEYLRIIIPETVDFGGVVVVTKILFDGAEVTMPNLAITTAEQVATIFFGALYGNPLFIGAILLDDKIPPMQQEILGDVTFVICPQVIQFYNDNLANLCKNFVGISSDVFAAVVKATYGNVPIKVSFTPYAEGCIKLTDFYCPKFEM